MFYLNKLLNYQKKNYWTVQIKNCNSLKFPEFKTLISIDN